MKRHNTTTTLLKRLPRGFALPAAFDAFVKTAAATDPAIAGYFDIMWRNPGDLGFRRESIAELIPFLRLGDGGVVAFWLQKNAPASATPIVHLDSEGQNNLIAANFDDFLTRIALRKTTIPDIDEADTPITLPPKILPSGKPAKILPSGKPAKTAPLAPALRARFAKWIGQNLDRHTPANDLAPFLEQLRERLHALARKLLRDGFSTTYKDSDIWWSLDIKANRQSDGEWELTSLDYGKWKPLPPAHRTDATAALFRALLANVKHPKRATYQIAVAKNGLVSVERDRELLLEPPKPKTTNKH